MNLTPINISQLNFSDVIAKNQVLVVNFELPKKELLLLIGIGLFCIIYLLEPRLQKLFNRDYLKKICLLLILIVFLVLFVWVWNI